MKNLISDIQEALLVTVNSIKVLLKEGDIVSVETDSTDFDEIYTGEISFVNVDCISINNSDNIPWEYIVNLSVVKAID